MKSIKMKCPEPDKSVKMDTNMDTLNSINFESINTDRNDELYDSFSL